MENDNETTNDNAALTSESRFGPFLLDTVVEALVFTANEPVTAAQIAKVFSDVSGEDIPTSDAIHEAVDRINGVYDSTDRAFRIRPWAGGYRLATISEMAHYVQALQRQDHTKHITRSLMETVAILAYRQPVTKIDIEAVRGVNCDYAIRRLLEYGLIDVSGRAESIGRPLLYGTTDRFLDLFGLNAISDLPNLREIEDILDDPAFQKDHAKLMMTSGLGRISSDDSGVESGERSSFGEDHAEA